MKTHQSSCFQTYSLPKTNIDTQNDGLEKVSPLKYGHVGYLYSVSRGTKNHRYPQNDMVDPPKRQTLTTLSGTPDT